jgi:hypothetical protein
VEGTYGCILTVNFAMLSGDGPKAREMVMQAGELRTLVGLGKQGDRRRSSCQKLLELVDK